MHAFNLDRKFVGRTEDGSRLYVDAELRDTDREVQTTDHRTAKGQRFAMTGDAIGYRCREPYSCGQNLYMLLEVTKPAKGVTLEDLKFLHDTWKANHLNDMQALCDHQTAIYEDTTYGRRLDLDAIGPCPVSGYKPGSAWLYRAPDDAAMERVYAILSKLQ